jgi:hypothetical protein
MMRHNSVRSDFVRPIGYFAIILCAAAIILGGGLQTAFAGPPAGCDPPPKPQKLDLAWPINLDRLKSKLVYYRCKDYDDDIARVDRKAAEWIETRASHVDKPALVLDIDETSLSNWKEIYQNDFGYITAGSCDFSKGSACGETAWELSASAAPIEPTLKLFDQAKKMGMTVFFISGRGESAEERAATEKNLREVGYHDWQQLYLRTKDFGGPSVAPFKTWARRDIENHGYHIIANVGDQWSDLSGGHSERKFKLPNPFYYIQ